MDAQAATALDLWLYARNAAQFVVSYPYFYLFPVLTIARNSALANAAGSDKLPKDSPNFFTAFIFPFKPFCVWVVGQVFREVLTAFLGRYLGHFAKTIIAIVVCAPLNLLCTWAIVRGNRSPLRNLAFSIRSVSFASWGYYVSTLLACEAVELLIISLAALPFRQTAQGSGVIPQQTDEATSNTNSTWVLALFAAIIGPVGIVAFLEWFPATVICVRAALSLLDPGAVGRGQERNHAVIE
ncbi:Hypothetical protein NCS54_00884700 [Fusarium falciforme]|uniref:Hypothetical protein n=1 Tax=Fusarium falciforme TaxID=195108 RepID=UPI002301E5BC|nr:Hypothetical protein NCS54_00884700 [Fusarium falciforme]WAO91380.1 Hypothetical protein NCS54_00884700 [Fusarium falciforme]